MAYFRSVTHLVKPRLSRRSAWSWGWAQCSPSPHSPKENLLLCIVNSRCLQHSYPAPFRSTVVFLLITGACPQASSFNINEKHSDSNVSPSHFNCQICKHSCLTTLWQRSQNFSPSWARGTSVPSPALLSTIYDIFFRGRKENIPFWSSSIHKLEPE